MTDSRSLLERLNVLFPNLSSVAPITLSPSTINGDLRKYHIYFVANHARELGREQSKRQDWGLGGEPFFILASAF